MDLRELDIVSKELHMEDFLTTPSSKPPLSLKENTIGEVDHPNQKHIPQLTMIEEEYHSLLLTLQQMAKQISDMTNQVYSLYSKTGKVLKKIEGGVPRPSLYPSYTHSVSEEMDTQTFSVPDAFLDMVVYVKRPQTPHHPSFTKLEIMDVIHTYIKKECLPIDPITRIITCDNRLTSMFGGTTHIPYFDLSSLVDTHLTVIITNV